MTFADARKILNGGDTAATNFFKAKTHDKLYLRCIQTDHLVEYE